MLTVVDRTIPGLISRLKNTGELANTVFVFTSDNGYHYGLHRHPSGKNLPYEEDMRVPLVVRGPGIEKAAGRDEFVLNNDLAPTFADLAGAKVPGFVDGRSFRTLAEASGGSNFGEPFARENFLFEGHPGRAFRGYGLPPYKTIRTSRYIYTEYAAGSKELYDIIADPYQLENIAGKGLSLEADLSAQLRTLKNCAGDSCRAAENSS